MAYADSVMEMKRNKNHHAYWRPITAIRTLVDPNWCPLLPTPPDQEYFPGHPSATGASLHMLENIFGTAAFSEPIVLPSTDNAPSCKALAAAPPVRTFHSLAEAKEDVIMGRVWGGMHYEASDRTGSGIGETIADYVFANNLNGTQGNND